MNNTSSECPVCLKTLPTGDINEHVNRCIFLNSSSQTIVSPSRKRQRSPIIEHVSSPTTKSCGKTAKASCSSTPLAKQVQPDELTDFIGQEQALGPTSALRTLISNETIPNMILWGPPGCGKTTLAHIIGVMCKRNPRLRFASFCGSTTSVKDVNACIEEARNCAKFRTCTVLFMDEIHRFTKSQQDTFLVPVERGEIILIGATTENPSFRLNGALLSRCRVVRFEKLSNDDLIAILMKAIRNQQYISNSITMQPEAIQYLAEISDGDARLALNNMQMVLQAIDVQSSKSNDIILTREQVEATLQKSNHMLYDNTGEEHYNLISALHKSIRASDANAAVYYLMRMLEGGEDPVYVARRLVRAASEDIGNAQPQALTLAVSTMQGCQLLGMPEADCLLAQCVIYLSRAPKSREADEAVATARRVIKQWRGPHPNVPMHLRNAPTKMMREMGYGKREAEYQCNDNLPKELHGYSFISKN